MTAIASPTAAAGTTALAAGDTDLTCTGARRRHDSSLAGQLNVEWARLRHDAGASATVRSWAADHEALSGCASPADVEKRVVAVPESADRVLLTLIRLAQDGEALAGRTVLQLMLGKAIRIAATRARRDSRQDLEHVAVGALWTTIVTYPVDRRPTKVAANLAMETLCAVTRETVHLRTETPAAPEILEAQATPEHEAADVELLNLLVWAVEHDVVTAADATLVLDIYSPAPGEPGGAAAAVRHGLSWAAARQRASRATRRIARAIRVDVAGPLAG